MKLIEAITDAERADDDDTTIYASQPWARDSEAVLISPSPDTTKPIEREGVQLHYFLETFIVRDVLDGLVASDEDKCSRLGVTNTTSTARQKKPPMMIMRNQAA